MRPNAGNACRLRAAGTAEDEFMAELERAGYSEQIAAEHWRLLNP
jgi:hypothetical protein